MFCFLFYLETLNENLCNDKCYFSSIIIIPRWVEIKFLFDFSLLLEMLNEFHNYSKMTWYEFLVWFLIPRQEWHNLQSYKNAKLRKSTIFARKKIPSMQASLRAVYDFKDPNFLIQINQTNCTFEIANAFMNFFLFMWLHWIFF